MDLRRTILQAHTKGQTLKVADYVKNSPIRFKALIDIYLAGPYRVTQRCAWPLSICVERYPQLITPHLKKILDFVQTPGVHDAVKRNTMRLLQYCTIPKRHHAQVINLCFDFLLGKNTPVAVKAFSITVLNDMIQDQADLKNELRVILEDQLPYSSPAFVSRARKVLKTL